MFNLDLTFEDLRILARSNTGIGDYDCTVSDAYSGETRLIQLTPKQLQMIIAFNLDRDGEPEGFEQYYAELEPIFEGWPTNLRPIP
jgi:hypothetical protein